MKNITIAIVSFSLLLALSAHMTSCGSGQKNHEHSAESHDDSAKVTHVCPMHADEKGTAEDKCSKCGMALEPIAVEAEASCPMHPEEKGSPGDKCSKCGMSLEPIAAVHKASCPMHPEETGSVDDKCSKCGMALVMPEHGEDH